MHQFQISVLMITEVVNMASFWFALSIIIDIALAIAYCDNRIPLKSLSSLRCASSGGDGFRALLNDRLFYKIYNTDRRINLCVQGKYVMSGSSENEWG